jgi:hypothetical protein
MLDLIMFNSIIMLFYLLFHSQAKFWKPWSIVKNEYQMDKLSWLSTHIASSTASLVLDLRPCPPPMSFILIVISRHSLSSLLLSSLLSTFDCCLLHDIISCVVPRCPAFSSSLFCITYVLVITSYICLLSSIIVVLSSHSI